MIDAPRSVQNYKSILNWTQIHMEYFEYIISKFSHIFHEIPPKKVEKNVLILININIIYRILSIGKNTLFFLLNSFPF